MANTQGFILPLIEAQKALCNRITLALSETITPQVENSINLDLAKPALQGVYQQNHNSFDNIIFVNQSLAFAQELENYIFEDYNQNPEQVFNKNRFQDQLSQINLKMDLSKETFTYLFQQIYHNRISNSLKFIHDTIIKNPTLSIVPGYSAQSFMDDFSFRLIYELIKRDLISKALEIIKGLGWSQSNVLKSILYYSLDHRMCKVIQNHLNHKRKFSKVELKALEIKEYLEYLYPIQSVYSQRLKVQSKIQDQVTKGMQDIKNTDLVIDDPFLQQLYINLAVSSEINDLNFISKDFNDFKMNNINQPSFIDKIFEFKNHHIQEQDEDDFFSKQVCKLLGPHCGQCNDFIVNFEDLEMIFQPKFQNMEYFNKYLNNEPLANLIFEDKGYLILQAQWLLDILQQAYDIDIDKDIIQPIVFDKYKHKLIEYVNDKNLDLMTLLKYGTRTNSYQHLIQFIPSNLLKNINVYQQRNSDDIIEISQLEALIGMQISEQLLQNLKKQLANEGIFENNDLTNMHILIMKLAQINQLFPKFTNALDIRKLSKQTGLISFQDKQILQIKKFILEETYLKMHKVLLNQDLHGKILQYFIANGQNNIAFELFWRCQLSNIFDSKQINLDIPLFEFYRAFSHNNIAQASKFHAQHLYKIQNYQQLLYDKNEYIVSLATIFNEDKHVIQFKKDLEFINKTIKYKTLGKLIATNFKQAIEINSNGSTANKLSTYEGDVDLESLVSCTSIGESQLKRIKQQYQKLIQKNYCVTSHKADELFKLNNIPFNEQLNYYLSQGRPYDLYLTLEQHQIVDQQKISIEIYKLALQNLYNTRLTASCIMLMQYIGIETAMLKIDMATAKRIIQDRFNQVQMSEQEIENAIQELSKNVNDRIYHELKFTKYSNFEEKAAQIYLETIDGFIGFITSLEQLNEEHTNKSLLSILKYLEKATWNIEDSKRIEAQSNLFEQQSSTSSSHFSDNFESINHEKKLDSPWHLVGLFCKVHDLPPSLTLLHELARKNDWIMFLYEAQQQQCPRETVLDIINDYFQSQSIKNNLKIMLKEPKTQRLTQEEFKFSNDFEVIQDDFIQRQNFGENINLIKILIDLRKYLKQKKKLCYLGPYLNSLAFLNKNQELLILSQYFHNNTAFDLVFIALSIQLEIETSDKVKFTLQDLSQLIILAFKSNNFNKFITLLQIYDPQNPVILYQIFLSKISQMQFQDAQNIFTQILKADKSSTFSIGFQSDFTVSLLQELLIIQIYDLDAWSLSLKLQVLQIYLEHKHLFTPSLKKLSIKLTYLEKIGINNLKLNKSEILDQMLELREFKMAKQFIQEIEDDQAKQQGLIDYMCQIEVQQILKELQGENEQQERDRVLDKLREIIQQPIVMGWMFSIIMEEEIEGFDKAEIGYFDTLKILEILIEVMPNDEPLTRDLIFTTHLMEINTLNPQILKTLSKSLLTLDELRNLLQQSILLSSSLQKPNINMLISKEKSIENLSFLERIFSNLLSLNLNTKVLDFAHYFGSQDLQLLRKVRMLILRLDQLMILQQGQQLSLAVADIQTSLQDLKLNYPNSKLYVKRIQSWVKLHLNGYHSIEELMKIQQQSTLDESRKIQKNMLKKIIESDLKKGRIQEEYGQEFYKTSNLDEQCLMQIIAEQLVSKTLNHSQIKYLARYVQVIQGSMQFFESIIQSDTQTLELNSKLQLLAFLRQQSLDSLQPLQNEPLITLFDEAQTNPAQQLTLLYFLLTKITLSQQEQDLKLLETLHLVVIKNLDVIGYQVNQNKHFAKQILKVLQYEYKYQATQEVHTSLKLYVSLLLRFDQLPQLDLLYQCFLEKLDTPTQKDKQQLFEVVQWYLELGRVQDRQGKVRGRLRSLGRARDLLQQFEL